MFYLKFYLKFASSSIKRPYPTEKNVSLSPMTCTCTCTYAYKHVPLQKTAGTSIGPASPQGHQAPTPERLETVPRPPPHVARFVSHSHIHVHLGQQKDRTAPRFISELRDIR